jgi:hypothetical protein
MAEFKGDGWFVVGDSPFSAPLTSTEKVPCAGGDQLAA